jgi:ATP-dependent exoDNAse (exonuclease V) alpha subunit
MLSDEFPGGEQHILDCVEVWNTHQAQGREWDCVFFSASDTARLWGNDPWFSDSSNATGRALVNTTISRARQHLRIFFDRDFWRQRWKDSILTALARQDRPQR